MQCAPTAFILKHMEHDQHMKRNHTKNSRAFRWILSQVPHGNAGWRARQAQLGLNDAAQYRATIRSFLSTDNIVPTYTRDIHECSSNSGDASLAAVTDLTRRFAKCTEQSSASAALHRVRASFQRLILLSLCVVLRANGTAKKELHDVISWFSPIERVRDNCLKGISWVHSAILALYDQQGWTIERATELFFLIPFSVSRLAELHAVDIDDFTTSISKCTDQTCLTPRFAFPALIVSLFERHNMPVEISRFELICHALGYPVYPLSETRNIDIVISPERELQIDLTCSETYAASKCFLAGSGPRRRPLSLEASPRKYESTQKRQRRNEQAAIDAYMSWNSLSSPAAVMSSEDDIQHHLEIPAKLAKPSSPSSLSASARVDNFSRASRDESQDVKALLRLFHGPPQIALSHDQLLRGTSTQKRWDSYGNTNVNFLTEAGLSDDLVNLFSNRSRLEDAIHLTKQRGWLLDIVDDAGNSVYTLYETANCGHGQKEWFLDGLLYICHIFPREEALDLTFQSVAKKLLPVLYKWLTYVHRADSRGLPSCVRQSLIEILYAISRIEGPCDSSLNFGIASQFYIDDLPHRLRLLHAKAQSTFLSKRGVDQASESDHVVRNALQIPLDTPDLNDVRTCGLVKQLQFSLIENAILRHDYETALSLLSDVQLPTEQSTWPELEFQVAQKRLTLLGLVFRYTAKFEEAKHILDVCGSIGPRGEGQAHPYHVIRHRAELECELGRPGEAVSLLQPALAELQSTQCMRETRVYRKLCLANAEAQNLSMCHQQASISLDEVDASFKRELPGTSSDELDHIRVKISQMRHACQSGYLFTALKHATESLNLIEKYRFGNSLDYYKGLVLKFRAAVHLQLAQVDLESAEHLDDNPKHLIVGMGTYGREEILEYLYSSARKIVQSTSR